MIWLFLYFINELAYASQFQILLRGWLHDPAHLYTLKQDMFGLCYGGEPVVVYFFVFLAVEAIYLLQVEFYQRGEQSFRELWRPDVLGELVLVAAILVHFFRAEGQVVHHSVNWFHVHAEEFEAGLLMWKVGGHVGTYGT